MQRLADEVADTGAGGGIVECRGRAGSTSMVTGTVRVSSGMLRLLPTGYTASGWLLQASCLISAIIG